ncbi:hypothetical protein Tco_0092841 [Tanacetum coccineum]
MFQVANSNVGLVRAFKLMKEMYGRFENVGATATDCKKFRRDLNLFNGDRDAQMVVEKLENLKSVVTAFYGLLPRRRRFIMWIVWNERISIDMFEQEWASIMDEFDLGSHKWLCDLYDMRHR